MSEVKDLDYDYPAQITRLTNELDDVDDEKQQVLLRDVALQITCKTRDGEWRKRLPHEECEQSHEWGTWAPATRNGPGVAKGKYREYRERMRATEGTFTDEEIQSTVDELNDLDQQFVDIKSDIAVAHRMNNLCFLRNLICFVFVLIYVSLLEHFY